MCTDLDTDDYKEKIRSSCLRTIEKAEKLKQHLTGVADSKAGSGGE